MGVTININGLSLVHAGSGGISTATLPNVCLGPPSGQPAPYASVALSRHLVHGTRSLQVDGDFAAATAGSLFARSTGDEPGTGGGVVSGTHGAEASFLSFSPNVRLEGAPACRLTDKMLHNRGNTLNAGGLRQKAVKATAAKARADTVDLLLVDVTDAANQRVHRPYKVILRAKGVRRVSRKFNAAGQVVFKDVEKRHYRVIAVHGCYPEGYAEVDVASDKQVVQIQLKRESLRALAEARGIRLGANIPGKLGPEQATLDRSIAVVKQEFHDVIIGSFFSSLHGKQSDVVGGWFLDKARYVVQNTPGAQIELTPLFWAAAVMDKPLSAKELARPKEDQRNVAWRPNPSWPNAAKTPAEALQIVKDFISAIRVQVGDEFLPHVTRIVVINEPMNMITRAVTQKQPKHRKWYNWKDPYHFCKLILPLQRDKNYAKGEKKGVKFYRFRKAAYSNLAAIVEHTHALFPNADLIVNDYGVEGYDGKKKALGMRGYRFYVLIRELLARLSPTAKQRLRVGFQAHLRSGGQLENSGAAKEPLDFRPGSIRKQVERFKKLGVQHGAPLKICVTELDLELPPVPKKGDDPIKLYEEHAEAATTVRVKKKGKWTRRKRKPTDKPFDEQAFFKNRDQLYQRAFTIQRDLMRDSVAAILRAGNVQSFEWWDLEDGLLPAAGGSNFRYHGYLFHKYVVCKHCQAATDVQVDNGLYKIYRKPAYWGSVAAFRDPVQASNV